MKILVTGATGMVGAEVIRQAILDDAITSITTLARRPLTIQHPKLHPVIHDNFLDYSNVKSIFAQQDACLWCLGISQTQVNKDQYHVITYDYAVAAGEAAFVSNPDITFMFLSGEGADTTEQSKTLFARVKGKTENALNNLHFENFYIVRPGGIRPITRNPNAPFLYKLLMPLFPVMEFLTPNKMINSVQLAKAMLHILKTKPDQVLFNNVELKNIALALDKPH